MSGAVRIVRETGKTIPQVAGELGISPGTLHSWVSWVKRNGSPTSDAPAASPSPAGRLRGPEREELERLRAEAREKDKRIRVLKVECVHRQPFRTRAEARIKFGTWIADFCNTRRLHSVCGFVSPVEFERRYWAEQVLQEAAQELSTPRGD
ncbi:IS3 family transposase (plasmid) [Streptomyces sp. NBC_01136]|uniref:IS3 family transposase n=1 Tax=unclassified Streptomyces TaxID=2593676 RepID=UPI003243E04F|nr:IS3 family transposase [Streptomyces sp. NBC_01136]